jgi:hypothetical protein
VHIRPANPRRTRRLSPAGAAVATAALTATAVCLHTAGTGPVAQAAAVPYDPFAKALDFNTFVENETVLVSTVSEGPMATGAMVLGAGAFIAGVVALAAVKRRSTRS